MAQRLWGATIHVLQHTAVVIAGIIMIVVGLALTFSIVFLLPGIIVLALGACVVVGGIFAHSVAGP